MWPNLVSLGNTIYGSGFSGPPPTVASMWCYKTLKPVTKPVFTSKGTKNGQKGIFLQRNVGPTEFMPLFCDRVKFLSTWPISQIHMRCWTIYVCPCVIVIIVCFLPQRQTQHKWRLYFCACFTDKEYHHCFAWMLFARLLFATAFLLC